MNRPAVTLAIAGMVSTATGTDQLLLSGYCPPGHSCLVTGSVGAVALGAGLLLALGSVLVGDALRGLGSAFLAVGIGGLTAGSRGAGWVGMVIGGEFAAVGLILIASAQWVAARRRGRGRAEAALWTRGLTAHGVVLEADDTGQKVDGKRIYTFTLRVRPGHDGDPFDAVLDHPIAPDDEVQVGDLYDVRYDPEDRRQLVIGSRIPDPAREP